MNMLRRPALHAILVSALVLMLGGGRPGFAQSVASPAQLISEADARVIIEGAIAYARENNGRMGVAVLDTAGEMIAGERMDGASGHGVRFAEGKAYAAVMMRTTTQVLSELYKSRPDRYFGIMNMYGDKVLLDGGGVPIAVDGKLIGAVAVSGLPQFEDERAAKAGLAAWEKTRASGSK